MTRDDETNKTVIAERIYFGGKKNKTKLLI